MPDDALEAYFEDWMSPADWALYGGAPNDDSVATGWINVMPIHANGVLYPITDFTGLEDWDNQEIYLENFLDYGTLDLSTVGEVFALTVKNCFYSNILFPDTMVRYIFVQSNPYLDSIVIATHHLDSPLAFQAILNNELKHISISSHFSIYNTTVEIRNNPLLNSVDLSNSVFYNVTGTLANQINVSSNDMLSYLDFRNGFTTYWTNAYFFNNDNLQCILVDHVNYLYD